MHDFRIFALRTDSRARRGAPRHVYRGWRLYRHPRAVTRGRGAVCGGAILSPPVKAKSAAGLSPGIRGRSAVRRKLGKTKNTGNTMNTEQYSQSSQYSRRRSIFAATRRRQVRRRSTGLLSDAAAPSCGFPNRFRKNALQKSSDTVAIALLTV